MTKKILLLFTVPLLSNRYAMVVLVVAERPTEIIVLLSLEGDMAVIVSEREICLTGVSAGLAAYQNLTDRIP